MASGTALALTGNVVGDLPQADLRAAGGTITLTVGSDVQIGQTVATSPSGQVELLFSDGTQLVVGPSSSLLVEDYLFRTDVGTGKLTADMLGGTFRFITGSMPKSSSNLSTPSGTIGIRDTKIEIYVNAAGNSLVTPLEG